MKQLSFEEIKNIDKPRFSKSITIVVDSLRTPQNIASIFRIADAMAIEQILFYQSTFEKYHVEKLSRSTVKHIPYSFFIDSAELYGNLQSSPIIGLEWTDESRSIHDFTFPEAFSLVIGGERHGISNELLDLCTHSVHIPMLGNNSSMNVAVATGIACYECRRQEF